MKKILCFPILLLIFTNSIYAQNELSKIEKLATTAKIWGFLKYYHPEVANGKYNWDKQLFKVLPKVETATNNIQLSQVYIDWIKSLGEIKPCKKCDIEKGIQYFDKNFDLNWINNKQIFTTELSEKLKYIELNRHQGKKHYVNYYSNKLKIPDFTNEVEYENFDWQNGNLRLLTLFRYWNQIEYFFPAKYQTDTNWDVVLAKMMPKFLNPQTELDLHLAILELIVSCDDSHATYFNEKTYSFFGRYYLPVNFKVINKKAVITGFYNDSLAKLNDLQLGDIIIKSNDKKIETILEEQEKYINASNISRKKFNASYYTLNGATDSVKIEFIRNGKTSIKSIKRYLFKDFKYKAESKSDKYKILENNIGYINIGKVKEVKEVPKIMEALKNTKAIIFDIRKYKTSTPYYFANYITSQKKDFYKALVTDLDYPGRYIWSETFKSGNDRLKYTGKVILLVDESCQSQLEFTAMCLQTGDNVTTIGSQTSGADGNVVIFNMVGGYKTQISGVGIFYPDGTETQRKGVKIDIKVKPTIEGVIAGKDQILERAIKFINE
ncbi:MULTISPECIES: S41 family peptidase [unclassified Cellulophaga]|uniref:S41 family peptidase n=1 Tax=unclassified Cellulophaga TaxID=2634405 RepID=UPI0026E43240|nr:MULTISPECIES: S41 family peptidase [unclassified Cellulophaga]MDO6493086.1 S41 family peptidase [Cellulophaga sp. 2_MG-2023]MDO6496407.1 S41 family peptidase [Cellulophaga sp. 3_MG-2023]